ncbi:Fructose-bisphosphate aldolase class-II [Acididesulfobacillus acetoxydans]|uniref:Fructose-bisphosphate aldolase n=1 Tax=Acididesulfobacillus acetoxydans TaxID=1561005 RepID=A0A8S0XW20_9FIRM|nr:class II fructose-bisphosphate aldolase [Acididesulfobacillus acetoxydans]CAA7600757.1 Fructose-bisphosphate aldolase class-II [Acididesulfobacillus acetoxydans]CEJ05696.1 Fructose-bisphosphate aldolase [Acididesulfobacillus acetoxydans]
MPLIPLRPLLEATRKHGFAQGAFNVNSVVQAQAVIEVHEMFRSAGIVQGADLANAFMGGRADFMKGTIEDKRRGARRIGEAVKKLAQDSPIPIVLHLDHGKDFESVKAAIAGGYTSVMIDGSPLPFDENVELTREVVKYAHARGVSVEGELGVLSGMEDDVFSEHSTYTNPLKAVEFFKKTGVDCLAISYGTKHGAVKGENVRLRKEIVIAVAENLKHEGIFGVLVSHGSSVVPQYIVEEINQLGGKISQAHGIPLDELKSVIKSGIGKINVDTDIRLAVTRNIREYFARNSSKKRNSVAEAVSTIWELMERNPEQFDPREYLTPIMEDFIVGEGKDFAGKGSVGDIRDILACVKSGVREVVGSLIVEFGAVGHAAQVEVVSLDEMANRYRCMPTC